MEYTATHWDADYDKIDALGCGVVRIVDNAICNALKEYSKEIDVQFGLRKRGRFSPDAMYVYLAEDRKRGSKPTDAIGKSLSLKGQILMHLPDPLEDGSLHPEDCDNTIAFAKHLESIAKALRDRVSAAQKVNHLHEWK